MSVPQISRALKQERKVSERDKFRIVPAQNDLQEKFGPQLNSDVLARAEAALKLLSAKYPDWLQDELDGLETARTRVRKHGYSPDNARTLYTQTHDLRGLGGTFEFPIVTRMAGSLCHYLDQTASPDQSVIDAHVDAIKAVVRCKVRDESNQATRDLAVELERIGGASSCCTDGAESDRHEHAIDDLAQPLVQPQE